MRRQVYLQIMALPAVIWMVIFCYIPISFLVIAFTDYSIFNSNSFGNFVGLKHFIELLNDPAIGSVLQNTFAISLLKILLGFPLPIIFAILLNELKCNPFKRIVQTLSYLPHFLSWIILAGIMINWLSDTGMITELLVDLKIIPSPVYFLGDPNYFWGVAVISDVWKEVGFNSIIFIAAIASLDTEIYEAADIDGAGRLRKILNITLPGISETMLIIFILSIANIFNVNFDQIFALFNQLNMEKSQVIDIFVYKKAFSASTMGNEFSVSDAAGLTRGLMSAALLYTANYITKRISGKSMF